jgi:hypothetical protein
MSFVRKQFIFSAFTALFLFSFASITVAHEGHEHSQAEVQAATASQSPFPVILIGTGVVIGGIGAIILYKQLFHTKKE